MRVGAAVGTVVGEGDGTAVGANVGALETVGCGDGLGVGSDVGTGVGRLEIVGAGVGSPTIRPSKTQNVRKPVGSWCALSQRRLSPATVTS